jgi:uncharacterized protein YegP (UPF0339 family)
MSTKNKPGIHLYKTEISKNDKAAKALGLKTEFYWHIVARNGRIIARSSETYTRKSGAVKSIKITGQAFWSECTGSKDWGRYYDHSKPDSKLTSYL